MRKLCGGKWISMLGIPPFIILFMPLMIFTAFHHQYVVARRRRRIKSEKVNKAFLGSWF
jgi:multidrug efflux pump